MKYLAILCAAALAGCATTGTVTPGTATNTALVDTDQAIIVAQDSYHLASIAAAAIVASPSTSPATVATIKVANDKAASALHLAYQTRTSSAVAAAVALIGAFSTLTGSK